MKWFTRSKHDTSKTDITDIPAEQKPHNSRKKRIGLTIYEMVLFSMFGGLMFVTKILMEFLPNMHLLGMFIVLFTVVYRVKALIPIYIFVILNGIISGFAPWWIPYLYVWAVLWAMAMLIPKNIPKKFAVFVYPIVCSLHGFLFGILYAPAQAIMFGLNFEQLITWVIAGTGFDITHGISNLVLGILIYPLSVLLKKLNSTMSLRLN